MKRVAVAFVQDLMLQDEERKKNSPAPSLQNPVELPPHEVQVRAHVPAAIGDAIERVRENEIDGAVGDSLDAGFIVFKEDVIEKVV